jgi:F0F1-type ATP synthase alpha subunit
VDAAYLDASIIQSKGIKVRASMANFRAQKYLTFLQQKVNKEKAKSIQRGDELHTVLEIPLNLSPLPIYADYS